MQTIQASIVSVKRFNATIWQYVLKPTQFIPYQAGQYLQIHSPDGPHYYSIANAPDESHYELHVRHRSAPQRWTQQQNVEVSLPYGVCDVRHLHPHKPILFLAVGTGFAPIRAMIDRLFHLLDTREFALHWRVSIAEDLYDQRCLQRWQIDHPHFLYYPYVTLSNHCAWISEILTCHPDLAHWQIVMAGPFELMHAMQKELLQHGLDKHTILSDAFEFSQES